MRESSVAFLGFAHFLLDRGPRILRFRTESGTDYCLVTYFGTVRGTNGEKVVVLASMSSQHSCAWTPFQARGCGVIAPVVHHVLAA